MTVETLSPEAQEILDLAGSGFTPESLAEAHATLVLGGLGRIFVPVIAASGVALQFRGALQWREYAVNGVAKGLSISGEVTDRVAEDLVVISNAIAQLQEKT